MDVDHFKQVNDTHGHAIGDQVLRVVANLLLAGVRETDKVVRYGGEEFVVVLCDCHTDDALLVADRLRRSIERHRWQAYVDGEDTLTVTASIGVAVMGDGEPPSRLAGAGRCRDVPGKAAREESGRGGSGPSLGRVRARAEHPAGQMWAVDLGKIGG